MTKKHKVVTITLDKKVLHRLIIRNDKEAVGTAMAYVKEYSEIDKSRLSDIQLCITPFDMDAEEDGVFVCF